MKNPKINIIAAIGKNKELGKDNKLLWHIKKDLQRFKELTLNHPVIMGRKTFESIGRILPNRTNIIITRDKSLNIPNTIITYSVDEAIDAAKKSEGAEEIFIIGGGQIFKEAVNLADKLYLTIVDKDFEADTFFPDYKDFKKVVFKQEGESEGFKYTFIDLEK